MTDLKERRGLDDEVYQPAEDTHLLATAAVEHLGDAETVLDVGTGSGYVGATIAAETDARVIGSDLNPHACREAHGRGLETVRADLVDPFAANAFDAVVCNPPYLPEEPAGAFDDWMEVALSGGETGREIVEQFLSDVGRVLTPDGTVFLLVSTLTGVDEVVERASEEGFSAVAVVDESYPFETLTVLKLVR